MYTVASASFDLVGNSSVFDTMMSVAPAFSAVVTGVPRFQSLQGYHAHERKPPPVGPP